MEEEPIETRFTELYNQTYPAVLRYVLSKCGRVEDVRDILQDVYTDVYIAMKRKGGGHICNPGAFAIKVAKAKLHRYYTVRERWEPWPEPAEESSLVLRESLEPTMEDQAVTAELIRDIAAFIAAKPDICRRIFLLFYVLGLSIPEIAALLSLHASTVKNWLYRTRSELRRLYEKE